MEHSANKAKCSEVEANSSSLACRVQNLGFGDEARRVEPGAASSSSRRQPKYPKKDEIAESVVSAIPHQHIISYRPIFCTV